MSESLEDLPIDGMAEFTVVMTTTYRLPRNLDDRLTWYGTTDPIGCWMVDYINDPASLILDGCDGLDVISIKPKP